MVKTNYLGKKGFAIFKNKISLKEQFFIRNELNVRAYIPKSPVQPQPFKIYRESDTKLYIPRYFGEKHFGIPDDFKIKRGDKINLKFNGTLREYQENIVKKFIDHVYLNKWDNKPSGGGLLDVEPGKGKTVMGLKIISELKTKTLVVVHKSFLLNQWIERIQQFLPDAKVGKIQGKIIDIEGKDIVIGMIQSLSQKDYDDGLFDSFGLTVYDECHHLSAEIFSRCMMKIVTNYTLGLSGTMQRKDGLTKVFKMFLGDVIHKEISEKNVCVNVKGIYFETSDEPFYEVLRDFKGNVMYSSMISKLCKFKERSLFIIDVLKNELSINNKQQIMILAHNKNLIKFLYEEIEKQNIASVGYYVGGMKEEALKESENKKIIIGTYAMASEGLDIKTLTTLLMATPKTDVCQSVGRILRTKEHQPLVIDIIDPHDVFKKQWSKRQSYYKKQNYLIKTTDKNKYFSDTWDVLDYKNKNKNKKNDSMLEIVENNNEEKYDGYIGKCLIQI